VTFSGPYVSLGWVIALLVLVAAVVIYLTGEITPKRLLALIAALALARLT
jgi:hypothetical protein